MRNYAGPLDPSGSLRETQAASLQELGIVLSKLKRIAPGIGPYAEHNGSEEAPLLRKTWSQSLRIVHVAERTAVFRRRRMTQIGADRIPNATAHGVSATNTSRTIWPNEISPLNDVLNVRSMTEGNPASVPLLRCVVEAISKPGVKVWPVLERLRKTLESS